MAIAEKRQIGTHMYSLGANIFSHEMVLSIPTYKILHALGQLKRLINKMMPTAQLFLGSIAVAEEYEFVGRALPLRHDRREA